MKMILMSRINKNDNKNDNNNIDIDNGNNDHNHDITSFLGRELYIGAYV